MPSLTTVNSLGILDGSIVDADISTSAAIAASKISGLNLGELETDQTITADKTFAGANKNYGLMGPIITVDDGITLQVTEQTSVLTII